MGDDGPDLAAAAYGGHLARVAELLPAATAGERGWALVQAVQEKHVDVARAILAAGGVAPDRLVEAFGQVMAVRLTELAPAFVACGVDVDSSANYYDKPPLVLAAERGQVDVVHLLLASHCDPGKTDGDGRNALAAARDGGFREVVAVLTAAGLDAPTRAQRLAALRAKLADRVRPTRIPVFGAGGGESWFGGLPTLAAGAEWPACAGCSAALTFFAQVEGVQFFLCQACAVVCPVPSGGRPVASAPAGVAVFPRRVVTEWAGPIDDYPHLEADADLTGRERDDCAELNLQGDKVGGWPSWVQDPERPECPRCAVPMDRLVLQLDSERGVPHRWGDGGVGVILGCGEHAAELAFRWQSG